MNKYSDKHYTLQLPENWMVEQGGEGSVSFYDPNGVGALTISSYSSSKDSVDTEEALEKFVKGKGKITLRNKKDFTIAESEYEDSNDLFTYAVVISREKNFVLASYHCKKENLNPKEIEIVKDILNSIEL